MKRSQFLTGCCQSIFTKEDINNSFDLPNISLHIVSKFAPRLTENQLPRIDIIDAWCYSSQTNIDSQVDKKVSNFLKFIFSRAETQDSQDTSSNNENKYPGKITAKNFSQIKGDYKPSGTGNNNIVGEGNSVTYYKS